MELEERSIHVSLQEVQEYTKMAKEMNEYFQKGSKRGKVLIHKQALEYVTMYKDLI